ncbi:aquaporin SIP1-1-like isoform X2 [Phaseolus vulgaris]|uniref:aquaporin SIP1-1-like isoform X2 n=1 Tax=Phaseolus vulgaris TaxID=3885 RepID=UPI0035CA84F6
MRLTMVLITLALSSSLRSSLSLLPSSPSLVMPWAVPASTRPVMLHPTPLVLAMTLFSQWLSASLLRLWDIAGKCGHGGACVVVLETCNVKVLGSVGGVLAVMEYMPQKYRHLIEGPSLKVSLHTGALAEGVLTFVITFVVLLIMIKGPRSASAKTLLMAISTLVLITVGATYTGPAMNPAFAFGWAYFGKWHDKWDHFYVYWICPFVGSILAAWLFRIVFPPPPPVVKQKKA